MLNFIEPATIDLFFTLAATFGLLGTAAITLCALPWTDEEIAATKPPQTVFFVCHHTLLEFAPPDSAQSG